MPAVATISEVAANPAAVADDAFAAADALFERALIGTAVAVALTHNAGRESAACALLPLDVFTRHRSM
jgi:hypothetical protein